MARMVHPKEFREVLQYKDDRGHRLPSDKSEWETYRITVGLPSPLRECPKCTDEPEPAKVGCHSPHAKWGNWNYCPICGAALTTEGA